MTEEKPLDAIAKAITDEIHKHYPGTEGYELKFLEHYTEKMLKRYEEIRSNPNTKLKFIGDIV